MTYDLNTDMNYISHIILRFRLEIALRTMHIAPYVICSSTSIYSYITQLIISFNIMFEYFSGKLNFGRTVISL